MKIVDSHCHVASLDFVPKSFVDGALSNMEVQLAARGVRISRQKLFDAYEAQMQDHNCDLLVEEMNAAGISKSILLVPDFSYSLKDCPLTIEELFLKSRDILARHQRGVEVFGGVDPRWGKDGLDLFARSLVEFGFRGFKVYPPCGFSPSATELFPFYELCAQQHAPVVVHIGPSSPVFGFGTTSPFLIDEAARQFPQVNFILAHGSVNFQDESVMLCRFRPNVYLDLSAYQSIHGPSEPGAAVKRVVSQGINHKVIFGTDWPVFRLQGDQATFVNAFVEEDGYLSDVSTGEKTLILHRNIERLLELPAQVHSRGPAMTESAAMSFEIAIV